MQSAEDGIKFDKNIKRQVKSGKEDNWACERKGLEKRVYELLF